MLAEDEEYEDAVLYERRSTAVLRSARSELVVPTPRTSRCLTGAPNSRLWPRACAATGLRASMMAEPRPPFSGRCLGWSAPSFTHRCAFFRVNVHTQHTRHRTDVASVCHGYMRDTYGIHAECLRDRGHVFAPAATLFMATADVHLCSQARRMRGRTTALLSVVRA